LYLYLYGCLTLIAMAQLRLSCFDNFRTMQIREPEPIAISNDGFCFLLLLLFFVLFRLSLCCRRLLIVFFNRPNVYDSAPNANDKRNYHMIII